MQEQGYIKILVDTAGYKSALVVYVVMASDCVIIPTRTSESDVQGLFVTLENVRASLVWGTKVFTVLNAVKPNTNIGKSVFKVLKENDVPLLSCKIGDKLFCSVFTNGTRNLNPFYNRYRSIII